MVTPEYQFTCHNNSNGHVKKNKKRPNFRGKSIQAVMEIEKGEKIIGAWITPQIPGTGFYKFLAKRKEDRKCEWVHFVQRFDGKKENLYRGEVESEKEIEDVISVCNNNLMKIYGMECRLRLGNPDVYSLDGKNLDNDTIN